MKIVYIVIMGILVKDVGLNILINIWDPYVFYLQVLISMMKYFIVKLFVNRKILIIFIKI